jgi:hypothetical protein
LFADYNYTCLNEGVNLISSGIVNTTTDFLVVLLPIPVIWKLRLPFRQRIAILALFGLGLGVCVAGIVRTVFTFQLGNGGGEKTYDVTWTAFQLWIASSLELNIGIVSSSLQSYSTARSSLSQSQLCASIPATKPFFTRYVPQLLDSKFSMRFLSKGTSDPSGSNGSSNLSRSARGDKNTNNTGISNNKGGVFYSSRRDSNHSIMDHDIELGNKGAIAEESSNSSQGSLALPIQQNSLNAIEPAHILSAHQISIEGGLGEHRLSYLNDDSDPALPIASEFSDRTPPRDGIVATTHFSITDNRAWGERSSQPGSRSITRSSSAASVGDWRHGTWAQQDYQQNEDSMTGLSHPPVSPKVTSPTSVRRWPM